MTTTSVNWMEIPNAVMKIPGFVFSKFELVTFYALLDLGINYIFQMLPLAAGRGLQGMLIQSLLTGIVDVAKIGGYDLVKGQLMSF